MERYFINSTKFTLRERNTLKGKVYDAVFRIIDNNGKIHQKSLCGYSTKNGAKNAHTDFVSKYCELLPRDFKPKKKQITFREAYTKYIQAKSHELKDSSIVSIENTFRKHVLPVLGNKEIDTITKTEAKLFIDDLCSKKKKDGTYYSRKYLNTMRTFISSMYVWLKERYEVSNPFEKAKVSMGTKSVKEKKLEFWDREQFDKFINVVSDETYKALFSTLFFTGCRKSEAFALTKEDYDGQNVRINKTVTRKTIDGSSYKVTANKNARDYVVPVCSPLKSVLDEYVGKGFGDGEYFFGGNKPLPPTSVQRAFSNYVALANVPKIKIHGLRHSFVSMLIHHGANYMVVASLIGDTPEQILRTYGHLWEGDREAIIKSIT